MTYLIRTSDFDTGRLVKHQSTEAATHHGAVMNVVQRRYRLPKGATIHVSTSYASRSRGEPDDFLGSAQGAYRWFIEAAPRPAAPPPEPPPAPAQGGGFLRRIFRQ
jgi:hypothetical protein